MKVSELLQTGQERVPIRDRCSGEYANDGTVRTESLSHENGRDSCKTLNQSGILAH